MSASLGGTFIFSGVVFQLSGAPVGIAAVTRLSTVPTSADKGGA
jgi:hypothetical protein